MGVTKHILAPGNGTDNPNVGDEIAMHYTGWVYDPSKPEGKGNKFDSSYDRGQPLKASIGIKRLIKGWDEGVPQMSLGEKALLTITPDYGYGAQGFPGLIPPNSTLLFDVHLVSIQRKGSTTILKA
ncbi:hypothetical protein BDV38DRAFT_237738 [Aspergillus pseudotamarii]|uniref:peptidylprolyl isomerase n=1 Tax=Aspergillus pseudotamarii TaxID=132259 RepID=A0A5N6T4X7_ASPPS|nr:uncharacterized protein BDV38DRAFT_237738 [Aspergillus pseudotamarii]KAE8141366.1 hypothetical protein BDV38DRAFT_237738 [Aspergillus pseudotamarii]